MKEYPILTENLSKSFGAFSAVRDLNLRVPSGAVYGFLGRNGAGKTTTMRMLLGLMRPTSGHAHVCGLDPARQDQLFEILERVAYLPQRKQLYFPMTVDEMLRFNRGFFRGWSDERATATAQALDIPMRTRLAGSPSATKPRSPCCLRSPRMPICLSSMSLLLDLIL